MKKFNQHLNDEIYSMVIRKWWKTSGEYQTQYQQTFKSKQQRYDIHRIIIASVKIGLFFEPEVAFTLWDFWSQEMGCSGWMTVAEDEKLPQILETIIETLKHQQELQRLVA